MDSNPVTIEIEAALAAQQQIIGNDAALDGAVAAFAAVLAWLERMTDPETGRVDRTLETEDE